MPVVVISDLIQSVHHLLPVIPDRRPMATAKPTRLASLFRKIHPPLSLDPRESQQLAQTLSKSFQDHLDKEHPKAKARTKNHSDVHISSILHNPHFNLSRLASSTESRRPRSSSTGSTPSAIEQLQTFVLDRSLFSFRQQIAAGEASLESAKEYLRICKGNRAGIPTALSNVPAAIASSEQDRVGLTVANWLWSTGLEESMEFVYDTDFVSLLVPRLCAEGQSERVERWVGRIQATIRDSTDDSLQNEKLAEAASFLVKGLIISTENTQGLHSAIGLSNRIIRRTRLSIDTERKIYGPVARRLSQMLTSLKNQEIDVALYEDFAINLPRCLRGAHLKQRLAWISLKHPTQPNANPALEFLRLHRVSASQDLSRTRKIAAIRSHIEVAEALLKCQRTNEAQEVMQILADSFPLNIQPSEPDNTLEGSATDVVNAIRRWSLSLVAA